MRFAPKIWGLGLLGAVAWLPAVGLFLAQPDRVSVPGWALALGVLGSVTLALVAGRVASRDSDVPRVDGAWAGAHVGGFAWLFGVAPFLCIWTQLPVLHPLSVAPDATTVMATALGEAVHRSAMLMLPGSALMLLGGAFLGALGARGGWGVPVPHRSTTAAAWIALVLGVLNLVAVAEAMGELESSLRSAQSGGMMLSELDGLAGGFRLQILSIGATGAICAAIVVAGLRGRVGSWPLVLATPVLATAFGLYNERLYGWAALVAAGMLLGAGLRLRPATGSVAPAPIVSLRVVPLTMAMGFAGAIQLGLAVGFGTVRRISELSERGAAAVSAPELVWLLAKASVLTSAAGLLFGALLLLVLVPVVNWVIDLGRARRVYEELLLLTGAGPRPEEMDMAQKGGVSRRLVAVVVVVGLMLGVFASGVAYQRGRLVGLRQARDNAAREEVIDVVVATRNLPVGRPIEAGDVAVRGMSPWMVPQDVVAQSVDQVIGKAPVERIVSNEILRLERLGAQPAAPVQP